MRRGSTDAPGWHQRHRRRVIATFSYPKHRAKRALWLVPTRLPIPRYWPVLAARRLVSMASSAPTDLRANCKHPRNPSLGVLQVPIGESTVIHYIALDVTNPTNWTP